MTDIPIIMSASMIRALLREVEHPGTGKTQTRRLAWRDAEFGLQDYASEQIEEMDAKGWNVVGEGDAGLFRVYKPTSWQNVRPGDRLWVRECGARYHTVNGVVRSGGRAFSEVSDGLFAYRADGHDTIKDLRRHIAAMSSLDLEAIEVEGDTWRPSIHMPRWASRLTLVVSATTIERLQDISEADIRAEGLRADVPIQRSPGQRSMDPITWNEGRDFTATAAFKRLWISLHGSDTWESNPEVVALTFKPFLCNIDDMPEVLAA